MSTIPFSVEPARALGCAVDGTPVDLSALQELGDRALVVELAQLFVDSTETLLDTIRAAMARADAGEVARVAHSVKGASASMGASQLRASSAALEAAAKRSELADMLTSLDLVEHHFAEATAYLRSELSL